MEKTTKQYYGQDVTIYKYLYNEEQPEVHAQLDEVESFGKPITVYHNRTFTIPTGREAQSFVGYGSVAANGSAYVVVADKVNIKQMTNIMLDLRCTNIVVSPIKLAEKSIVELITAERIDANVTTSDSLVSDQPGIISWEEMTITADTISMEDILPKKDKKKKRR